MAGAPGSRTVLVEFGSANGMLAALTRLREAGFTDLETFSPCPIDEAERMLEPARPLLGAWALVAGAAGGALSFLLQAYTRWDYPLNVGGRPLWSVPGWVSISAATAILFAALATVGGLLFLARLPALWHPVSEVEGIERASVDRFWIAVGGDPDRIQQVLAGLGPADPALRAVRLARAR